MSETVMGDAGAAAGECRHHWRIAPPDGTTSRGICKHCGAQRDFPNTTDSNAWEATTAGSPRPSAMPRRAGSRVGGRAAEARHDPPASPPEDR